MTPLPAPLHPAGPRRGFSLIEFLMVAFILAVGLLGLGGMQAATARAHGGAGNRMTAAILAEDRWQPQRARQDLRDFLDTAGYPHAGHCHVELIMKDISTVGYQPQRLWEWAAIASEVADEFAGTKT